jgi:hypothetical protein
MTQQILAEPVGPITQSHRPNRFGRIAKVLIWVVGIIAVLIGFYLWIVYPWMNHWGATDAEVKATFPGDELVPNASVTTTRAITVQAAPAQIYPWIVQLGVDRGGMYSIEWIENLMGLRVKNADRIREEWQNLQVGDLVRFTPKDYFLNPGPGLWVKQMVQNRVIVFCFGMETELPDPCTQTWQFILEPQMDGATRLVLRGQTVGNTGVGAFFGKLFQGPTFIMERAMLQMLKQRAEQLAATSLDDELPGELNSTFAYSD